MTDLCRPSVSMVHLLGLWPPAQSDLHLHTAVGFDYLLGASQHAAQSRGAIYTLQDVGKHGMETRVAVLKGGRGLSSAEAEAVEGKTRLSKVLHVRCVEAFCDVEPELQRQAADLIHGDCR